MRLLLVAPLLGCTGLSSLSSPEADPTRARLAGDTDERGDADTTAASDTPEGAAADAREPGDEATIDTATPTDPAPQISEVTIPTFLSAGDALTVTWRVTSDEGLGDLDGGPATWMFVGGPSGWVRWCAFPTAAERVAGDGFDGTYRATCDFPGTAPNAEYSLWINAYDARGQGATEVAGEFTVAGGSDDIEAPLLRDIEIESPVYSPGDVVVVRFRAEDATGVSYIVPWVVGPNGFLTAPDGTLWAEYVAAELESGDARNGVWRAEMTLSSTAVDGNYGITVSVGDTIENRSYLTGGFPTFAVGGEEGRGF